MAVSAVLATSLVSAATVPATLNIYAWTDKTNYDPGDQGTLHIVLRNDRTDVDLIIKNITITYPWFAYVDTAWEGNDTVTLNAPITMNGGVYTTDVSFTVPKDGRALTSAFGSSQINLVVAVDKSPYFYPTFGSFNVPLYVRSTPIFASLENMDQFTMLFTILVALVVVCTIILAATIFISARRPQVTWKAPEKEG